MGTKNPAQLETLTSVGEVDLNNDLSLIWDHSAGKLKGILPSNLPVPDQDGVFYASRYGATGDGVTDDTAAIAALRAAANSYASGGYLASVIFDPGTYKVTNASLFEIFDNLSIVGYGATIYFPSGGTVRDTTAVDTYVYDNGLFYSSSSDIDNFSMYGLYFNIDDSRVCALQIGSSSTLNGSITGSEVRVDDCTWDGGGPSVVVGVNGFRWLNNRTLNSSFSLFLRNSTNTSTLDSGELDIVSFGADRTGTLDSSPAINAANNAAYDAKVYVFYPAGEFKLSSTVTVRAPMICAGGGGPRSYYLIPQYGTRFTNGGVTGGTTGMLEVDSDTASPTNETGRGFYIDGGFSIDGNISGSPSTCIGFYAPGTVGVNVLSRYSIERVWVTGCSIGIYIVGFTGTIKDCYAIENTIGLQLDVANSVNVVGGEYAPIDDATSWAIRILSGSHINLVGVNAENEDAGATAIEGNGIDIAEGCKQVSIRAYLEDMAGNASTSGYHVRVGVIDSTGSAASNALADAATGISFDNTVSTANAAVAGTYGSLGPKIHLGNVIGVDLGTLAMTTKNLEVSQYAKNISGAVVGVVPLAGGSASAADKFDSGFYVTDATKSVGRAARSFIPNPSGRGSSGAAIRGYRDIVLSSGITIASETSIVRADGHSIKVTRAAAQTGTFSRAIFYPYGQDVLIAQQGTAVLTGWIYVPTAADGNPNDAFKENGSSDLRYPQVGFEYDTGSTASCSYAMSGGSGASATGYYALGAWTRFFCFKPMADFGATTRLGWSVYPIQDQAPLLSGARQDHSVYVTDVALFVSPQSWTDVLAGRFSMDPSAGTFIGDQFFASYTAAPTDANVYWKRGDTVFKSDPAVGSPDRWICTTAGVGGTATFTATANL